MAITAGDSACTTGLSGAIYTAWTGDPANGFSSPLSAGQIAMVKAQCYRWAVAIAAAHNDEGALARATVNVTAGTPGSAAIVGTARGISAVSIQTPNPPNVRAVRFTFSTAMPDTNYVAMAIHDYDSANDARWGQEFWVMTKATTHFEIGIRDNTTTGQWNHVDGIAHRFSALAYR